MASTANEDTGQSSSAASNSSWSRLAQAGPPEEEEDAQCPICLGHMRRPARVIYCMHKFCLNCIWLWSEASDNCPVCRQPIYHMLYSVQGKHEYKRCVISLAARVQRRMARVRRAVQPIPPAMLRMMPALQNRQPQRQEAAPGPSNAHSQQAPTASQEMAPLRESEGLAGPAAPLEPQNGTK